MRAGLFAAFLASCVWVGGSVAAAPVDPPSILLGSEELPELWGDGTVEYSPAYPGGRDHDYLAINRSWFGSDENGDRLQVHLRVLDSEQLEANLNSHAVSCTVNATLVAEGEPVGALIQWRWSSNPPPFSVQPTPYRSHLVQIFFEDLGQVQEVPSNFTSVPGEPAYYVWEISRAAVLKHATNLKDMQANCFENYAGPTPIINRDRASSQSDYSLTENRRVAAPDGSPDDYESLSAQLAPITPPSSAEAPEARSAAIGLPIVLVCLGLLGYQARRHR